MKLERTVREFSSYFWRVVARKKRSAETKSLYRGKSRTYLYRGVTSSMKREKECFLSEREESTSSLDGGIAC